MWSLVASWYISALEKVSAGIDRIRGGEGIDKLSGGWFLPSTTCGGGGNDQGTPGDVQSVLEGGGGSDVLWGGGKDDTLRGQDGNLGNTVGESYYRVGPPADRTFKEPSERPQHPRASVYSLDPMGEAAMQRYDKGDTVPARCPIGDRQHCQILTCVCVYEIAASGEAGGHVRNRNAIELSEVLDR